VRCSPPPLRSLDLKLEQAAQRRHTRANSSPVTAPFSSQPASTVSAARTPATSSSPTYAIVQPYTRPGIPPLSGSPVWSQESPLKTRGRRDLSPFPTIRPRPRQHIPMQVRPLQALDLLHPMRPPFFAAFVHLLWRTRQTRRYSPTRPREFIIGDLAREWDKADGCTCERVRAAASHSCCT
jgi:hypothetical protein